MTYLQEMDARTGLVDAVRARSKGLELNAAHLAATPFPHTVIDDFLPRPIIDACIAEFDHSRAGEFVPVNSIRTSCHRYYAVKSAG